MPKSKKEKKLMNNIGLQPESMKDWKDAGNYGNMKEIREFLDTIPNYLFLGQENEGMYI